MKQSLWKFVLSVIVSAAMITGCIEELDQGPPITTILNPSNGAVVDGIVPILVTASDDKSVSKLRLFIDGTQVSSVDDAALRYEWDTTPIADNRQHTISAYAIDSENNIGPSAITSVTLTALSQDTLPQVVTIQHPLDGQIVTGIVNIAVGINRSINNPIDSVQIYIDGAKVTTDVTFPYVYQWDVSSLIDGTPHTIFAISYDRFGYNISSGVTTVTVNTNNFVSETPIAAIEHPINNQTVSGLISLVARVQNVVGFNEVDSVVFVVDGFRLGKDTDSRDNVYTQTWDATNLPNGSQHTIFAVVYDKEQFNISTDVINVTVQSNNGSDITSPTVTIVYPNPNTQNSFSVSQIPSIRVVADAFDDTRVDSVQIYIDGIKQVTDTTPLYEYTWNFSGYATGIDHTIYIRAYDPSGNIGVAQTAVTLLP
jgi:hypothetical protein